MQTEQRTRADNLHGAPGIIQSRRRRDLAKLLAAWPEGKWLTAKELAKAATERGGYWRGPLRRPELHEALVRIAGGNGDFSLSILPRALAGFVGEDLRGVSLVRRGNTFGVLMTPEAKAAIDA